MSGLIIIQCLIFAGTIVTAISSFLNGRSQQRLHDQMKETTKIMIEVKHDTNSRLTELLDVTRVAAHGEGLAQGRAENQPDGSV